MKTLSIGIVGLPNVGKSTLFKILTKQEISIANYPYATIDPNVGIVPVPDERLNKLSSLSRSAKTIPAVVEFYDIAGLVKGANKGEGLGNKFLAHIRETQAIVTVLRVFKDPEIIHVEQEVDSLRDFEIVNYELALKDLETVEKRLDHVESDIKTHKKGAEEEKEVLFAIKNILESGRSLISNQEIYSSVLDNPGIRNLNLLSAKKQIYLLNGQEKDIPETLIEKIKNVGGDYVVTDLANPSQDAVNTLIQKAYEVLNLISFFTTGEKETHAWTTKRGTRAPQAAGVIHSDFEKNFIRAEVINWQKLLEAGEWNSARQKGWIRLEGKEYIVQDGDVVLVRHAP